MYVRACVPELSCRASRSKIFLLVYVELGSYLSSSLLCAVQLCLAIPGAGDSLTFDRVEYIPSSCAEAGTFNIDVEDQPLLHIDRWAASRELQRRYMSR